MAFRSTRLIVAFVALCLSGTVMSALALEASGFTYTVTKKKVTVTGLAQSDTVVDGVLAIPEELNGSAVTFVGDGAFDGLTGITSLVLPDSVVEIGTRAFAECSDLTQITFGAELEVIGDEAFAGCRVLTSVVLPPLVETIGDSAFEGCTALALVTLGDKVETIGDEAFASCSELTTITVPDAVETIGANAFDACGSLASVVLGSGLEWIDDRAFYDCTNLVSVSFLGDAPQLGIEVFENVGSATVYYASGTSGWTDELGGLAVEVMAFKIEGVLATGGAVEEGFKLTVKGPAKQRFVLEACSKLGEAWEPLETNVIEAITHAFIDKDSRKHPSRFYRVRGL